MKISLLSVLALSTLSIATVGCTTSRMAPAGGANSGVVNYLYTVKELRSRAPSCLYNLTADQIAGGKYISVRMTEASNNRIVSAFVPPSVQVEIGDEVELTANNCEKNLVPEVKQVLKRH
jgi:hypothetical protein